MKMCCFFGALLSVEGEEEESKALLELLVDHYITVRGFSFASGFVEKYKQAHKKSTQKSKGLRKQLLPSTQSVEHQLLFTSKL